MFNKQKGRSVGNRATYKTTTHKYFNPVASRLKALIVYLAVWGMINPSLATWLIQRGGLKDA
ncbi:hypothetical protein PG1C_05335 [Rugosibacter aromaticivorans]|uniref:Uncharacterized protein n=1 Tax=Rugosibacter aromaticivorans TaxID=1565605 RepID=A0A0C5IZ46_9PROT|nr:hypothetical protein PG1C_05335 [Rugosibacter aromaticivorans]